MYKQDTRHRTAFTLIELMVAILILLIGITGILAILPLAFNIQQNSKDQIMSEILAHNASAMLTARKIKYSDLRQGMLNAEFDVFQPMAPLDYPGATEFRSDNRDAGSGSSNALLYADTARMAFPLPNGRVSDYGDFQARMSTGRIEAARQKMLGIFDKFDGRLMASSWADIEAEVNSVYGSYVLTQKNRGKTIGSAVRNSIRNYQWYVISSSEATRTNPSKVVNTADVLTAAEDGFKWDDLIGEVRYTTGGRNDFDERPHGYGLTDTTGAARDRSRHLWGYNFSDNMMATYTGTGKAPAYLWTIKDRSFPSLSKKKVGKRDYFWVPLLYDADPRPGRFEWRAYIVVTVRSPGKNYKYQGQVHHDHGTSVQAFAANPRDPDTVPRVTALPLSMANSGITGSKVQRYSGGSYGPLNWVYYPDWPDTTSTATVQATVGRGTMSQQDLYATTPNEAKYHHGHVSGRFIPGDKFEITVNEPMMGASRDFSSRGWLLAGGTPTFLQKPNVIHAYYRSSATAHPIPYWDTHYNPRNSSFQTWSWMSHNNAVGRISVGRIMPVSGQVVDMSN